MRTKVRNIILVLSISLVIVLYGFIVISDSLPKFIKDRSTFKISYNLSPFDFRIDISEYSFYINNKVADNIKKGSVKLLNNIESKVYNNTSGIINRTSEVFKSVEEKINGALQNKVR